MAMDTAGVAIEMEDTELQITIELNYKCTQGMAKCIVCPRGAYFCTFDNRTKGRTGCVSTDVSPKQKWRQRLGKTIIKYTSLSLSLSHSLTLYVNAVD